MWAALFAGSRPIAAAGAVALVRDGFMEESIPVAPLQFSGLRPPAEVGRGRTIPSIGRS